MITAPGLVTRPVELHRGWIEGADEVPVRWGSATALGPGVVGRTCVVCFRVPVGIPEAVPQPQVAPRVPRPLDPSHTVEALALDLDDRSGASASIAGWAKQAPSTSSGEPPAPAAADAAPHRRRLVAWFVVTASLASLLVTLHG
ncbi:MAG: hypothetical protein KF703_10580 [Actinobacteria bacterium]|nr:hypothetical protein [Actinomycetota bacterium]